VLILRSGDAARARAGAVMSCGGMTHSVHRGCHIVLRDVCQASAFSRKDSRPPPTVPSVVSIALPRAATGRRADRTGVAYHSWRRGSTNSAGTSRARAGHIRAVAERYRRRFAARLRTGHPPSTARGETRQGGP